MLRFLWREQCIWPSSAVCGMSLYGRTLGGSWKKTPIYMPPWQRCLVPSCPILCSPPVDRTEWTFGLNSCIWGWMQYFLCNFLRAMQHVYGISGKTSCLTLSCPLPPCRTEMVISQLLIKIECWCLVHMKGLWKHFQDFMIWLLW